MPDVGVSELFRFRTTRSIQHKDKSSTAYVIPETNLPRMVEDLGFVLGQFSWIQGVSTKMALSADYLTPQQVIDLLPKDWKAQLAQEDVDQKKRVEDVRTVLHGQIVLISNQCRAVPPVPRAYGVSVVPPELAAQAEEYCRALLTLDLVVTLDENPGWLVTAQDVQTDMTFRNVVLPHFDRKQLALARQPGFTDLYVIKDEWNRYVAGELANVVNVLPGETFDEKTHHLDETDTTTSTTSQQTTSETTTNSQTTSQTLSQASTSAASTSIGAHAQVEIQGGWGPMQIKSNIGAQIQTSQSSSQTTSRTTAIQTVNSAVKTVTQTVIQSQTTRTKTKDTDFQEHKLQNPTQNPSINLYRWLSVVHRCQAVKYPHRFVLEFEIPEPGYWLRWALTNQPDTPWSNPDPGPFTTDGNPPAADGSNAISPARITENFVHYLAWKWRIQGLSPPPLPAIVVSQSYTLPEAGEGTPLCVADNSIEVPDGYYADTWTATIDVSKAQTDNHYSSLSLSVGTGVFWSELADWANTAGWSESIDQQNVYVVGTQKVSGAFTVEGKGIAPISATAQTVGGTSAGSIPVGIMGHWVSGGVINVVITCTESSDANGNSIPLKRWQQSTFDQIVTAYNALLSAYNQERIQRAQQQTGPIIVGPPDLNLARCVMELKKAVIQDLLGAPLTPQPLWQFPNPQPPPPPPGYGPSFNPPDTAASAPVVQFFEQAFEWENLVYICYPYFWGGQPTWVQNATGVSTSPSDPVFDQFLNAGSARVVVPARPGFESLVNWFLYTGQVWGGQRPPAPNEPDYLSIADEIEALQIGATDGTPVAPPWEVTLPTTYLWAGIPGTDQLPVNPASTIGPPP